MSFFKLFNFYVKEKKNKLDKFERIYINNLLI